jgi:ParB-like chromosome segregation protein Spo0J
MPDIIATILIKDIAIAEGRRKLNAESVSELADSIKKIGLRHPITVKRRDGAYILVAGRHRIAACESLGLDHISASIATMTEQESRLWEIAENVHRVELTVLERSNQIARWAELTAALSEVRTPLGGVQPKEKGIRKVARDLGITKTDAYESVKIASISPDVMDLARDVGLDDNRRALLEIAKETTSQAQVGKAVEIAKAKAQAKEAQRQGGSTNVVAFDSKALTTGGDIRQYIDTLSFFAEFCRVSSPSSVAAGLLPAELDKARSDLAVTVEWLDSFAVARDQRACFEFGDMAEAPSLIGSSIGPLETCLMRTRALILDEWFPQIPVSQLAPFIDELRDEIDDVIRVLEKRKLQVAGAVQ